jgi:hypothetical protein
VTNHYLYTPPTTEPPRHTHFGLIKGELLRYIKKSSSFCAYVDIACSFYQRMWARGFSLILLSEAFSKVPSYDLWDELLAKALAPHSIDSNSLPVLVFSMVFSFEGGYWTFTGHFLKSIVASATLSLCWRSVVFRPAPSECLA